MKKILALCFAVLLSAAIPTYTSAGTFEPTMPRDNRPSKPSLIGDWFAQIDIPQNKLVIILEFNFTTATDCTVTCTWEKAGGKTVTKKGKAKYNVLGNNILEIKFLNKDEWIRHDNVFDMVNTYQFTFRNGKFVILPHRQFRNTEVIFGKGYKNRGYSTITFK